jgi:hypothetical protein
MLMRAAATFLLFASIIHAQSLSGTIIASDGKKVSGAIVTATGTATVPWSITRITSAVDSSFTFTNLAPGPYRLCVQVPSGGYLDPCHWSPTAPAVTIVAGKSVTGLQLKIAAGSVLKVRLNDPAGIANAAVNAPPPVLMGVQAPNALFVPFLMRATDKNGSDHEVTVPFDVPVKVTVQSAKLNLAKSDGTPVTAAAVTTVTQSSAPGPPPPVLTFQITSLKP